MNGILAWAFFTTQSVGGETGILKECIFSLHSKVGFVGSKWNEAKPSDELGAAVERARACVPLLALAHALFKINAIDSLGLLQSQSNVGETSSAHSRSRRSTGWKVLQ